MNLLRLKTHEPVAAVVAHGGVLEHAGNRVAREKLHPAPFGAMHPVPEEGHPLGEPEHVIAARCLNFGRRLRGWLGSKAS